MDHDFKIEAAKGTPAVAGAAYSIMTLDKAVMAATLVYILLQTAYLIWKWRKEAKKHRK